MQTSLDFNRKNPRRRPDWRFERVLRIVDRAEGPGRTSVRDDEYVKGARRFIIRYRNATDAQAHEKLAAENPGLYFAWQIYENRNEPDGFCMPILLEARLLADMEDEAIAAELETLPEVVEWYEAIFFHVRDRLKAHDWIVDHVLRPSLLRAGEAAMATQIVSGNKPARRSLRDIPLSELTEAFMPASLKFFAYYGGPHVLNQAITGFRRGNRASTAADIGNWFDEYFQLDSRRRASAAMNVFQIGPENVMQLFALNVKLIEIDRNTDSAENKQDQYHRTLAAFMKEIPWAIGRDGRKLVADSPIAIYDDSAVELRDAELQTLSAGEKPDTIEGVELLRLPPPRRIAEAVKTERVDPLTAPGKEA